MHVTLPGSNAWGLREIMIRAKAVCDAMPNLRKQQTFGQQDADVDSFSIFPL